MAPKRQLPAKDPPPASSDEESSGEEEEEEEERESEESKSGSESDDEDDDKEEPKKPAQPKPSTPPPPPKQPQQKSEGGSASTESESESQSESESESESRRHTVKPIASKPMESVETPPAKKQKPEPSPSSNQPTAKRKVGVEDSRKAVKKDLTEKKSVQKAGDESKKPMFERIWGANDEIELLQGMIEFRERKGLDPFANTSAFHHFVKKSLGHEFTDNQLVSKMRVLKRKYRNNEGKDRVISKPHEQTVFNLSKKIWGVSKSNETGGSGEQTPTPKANGTANKGKTGGTTKSKSFYKASELEPFESQREKPKESGLIPFEHNDPVSMLQLSRIGLDEGFLKKGWEMVGESEREEAKERWGKLQLAEMRLLAERAELIQYQTNLILEACHQATGQ